MDSFSLLKFTTSLGLMLMTLIMNLLAMGAWHDYHETCGAAVTLRLRLRICGYGSAVTDLRLFAALRNRYVVFPQQDFLT